MTTLSVAKAKAALDEAKAQFGHGSREAYEAKQTLKQAREAAAARTL